LYLNKEDEMRVSPININPARGRMNTLKKQDNVSFGIINPKDREKIKSELGFSEYDDSETLEIVMDKLSKARGLEVKLGSSDNPRGMVYADIIPEEAKKSDGEPFYNRLVRKSQLDHLEDEEKFQDFYDNFYYAYKLENDIEDPPSSYHIETADEEFQRRQDGLLDMFLRSI